MDGQGTKCRRNIAENYNRLSWVHERYRQTDRRTGDSIANVNEPPHQKLLSAHFYCVQTVGHIKMSVDMEVGLSPGDFVLDGDPAPYPKRGRSPPQFSAHLYCGQTAGWIKVILGRDVGLSLIHI